MQLDLATAEYIGAREQQQDLAAAVPQEGGALLVLADGLGGHESGAEASRIVVTTFREAGTAGNFKNPNSCRQMLREVLDRANARIAEGVDPAHGHRGMASTVVAAVVDDGDLRWVSVGDSHLYLWRGGHLHKLNEDHSQAGLMVRSGQYKPSDPEVQAVKSVLVSALTGRKLEIVDLPEASFRLEPGDVLMLASDGLNTLNDEEIAQIVDEVQEKGAIKLSTTLLESVRSRRVERQDNTTVVIARVLEPQTAVVAPVRHPEAAAPELIDDDEERTHRLEVAAEKTEELTSATKPLVRSAAAATEAGIEPLEPAGETNAASTEPEDEELPRPAGLKSRSERPMPPGVDGEASAGPIALGAAPADLAPDLVTAPPPADAPHVAPRPLRGRSLLVLVALLLLASGVAIAAFKPSWLSSLLPGVGDSGGAYPSATQAPAAKSMPELAKMPAPAAPEAKSPADVSPMPASGAPNLEPASKGTAQASGQVLEPPPPAPANPPDVEAERPAVAPAAPSRAP